MLCVILLRAQEERQGRWNFVTGLSAPELLHADVNYRLAQVSMLGLSAGVGPSYGSIWPSISLEHRLYLGKNNPRSNRKTWFCRQGSTYFPTATNPSQHFTFNLTGGKDLPFKKPGNGF